MVFHTTLQKEACEMPAVPQTSKQEPPTNQRMVQHRHNSGIIEPPRLLPIVSFTERSPQTKERSLSNEALDMRSLRWNAPLLTCLQQQSFHVNRWSKKEAVRPIGTKQKMVCINRSRRKESSASPLGSLKNLVVIYARAARVLRDAPQTLLKSRIVSMLCVPDANALMNGDVTV